MYNITYKEAQEIVKSHNIKTHDDYVKLSTTKKYYNILPLTPHAVFKDNGWKGWKSFLDSHTWDKYLPYDAAHKIALTLPIKTSTEWARKHSVLELRSKKLPLRPNEIYKNRGWVSWNKFFGKLRTKEHHAPRFMSYDEAKCIIHPLKLQSISEYREYIKSNNITNLPVVPTTYYKNSNDWKDWSDYLGVYIKPIRSSNDYVSFKEARKIVRKLKLKGYLHFLKYIKDHGVIKGVPTHAPTIYKNKGWTCWEDFLGHKHIANYKKKFLPYNQARKMVVSLKIKSCTEWFKLTRHIFDFIPNNIPKTPNHVYANKDWKGWSHWLGTKCKT